MAASILAVAGRLLGPIHFLSFDEVMCRLFPRLRPAFRLGLVRIWHLRLRLEEGGEVACLLRGDLVGAAPLEGDVLRLEGSFPQGNFHISQDWNETTNGRLVPPANPHHLGVRAHGGRLGAFSLLSHRGAG